MRSLKSHSVARRAAPPQALTMSKPARRRTFIREWREFRDLSQEELADRIGMTGGNLSLLERGLINYTADNLEAIAGELDCTVGDLLERDPQDPEGIWTVWKQANPEQRRQIVEISKALLKPTRD